MASLKKSCFDLKIKDFTLFLQILLLFISFSLWNLSLVLMELRMSWFIQPGCWHFLTRFFLVKHVCQEKREMCHWKIVQLQSDLHMSLYLTKSVEISLKEKAFSSNCSVFLYLIYLWAEPLSDKFWIVRVKQTGKWSLIEYCGTLIDEMVLGALSEK